MRDTGPGMLATELGDVSFLLSTLAQDPGALFDASQHGAGEYVELVRRIHDARCALEAIDAGALVALADATKRDLHAEELDDAGQEAGAVDEAKLARRARRSAAREVSMIARRSPSATGRTLTSCTRLVTSMPGMLGALARGQVTGRTAHATATSTGALTPGQRAQVDDILVQRLPDLDAAGAQDFKDEVAGIIHQVDADGADRRHQHARTDRHVTVRHGDHGMATVSAHLPALQAAKVHKRLSLEAERLRAGGDRRGHQAIMADALVETTLGRAGGMEPVTLDVGVIITDRSLIAPEHGDIARIEGYGPVPAEAIRDDLREALTEPADGESNSQGPDGPALRAAFRRLYTHPVTGELVAAESIARAFSRPMAAFLRMRDTRCRGPFCDAPIRHSDHIHPHVTGGATSLGNGQGGCVFCNDKEDQPRHVTRESSAPGHRVTWTSRHGTTRTTTATRLTPPATTPSGRDQLPPGVLRGTSHLDKRPRRSTSTGNKRSSTAGDDEDDPSR